MKKLIAFLLFIVAGSALAQQPVTVQKASGTNTITGDLVIGNGRTIGIGANGTFSWDPAAVFTNASAFRTAIGAQGTTDAIAGSRLTGAYASAGLTISSSRIVGRATGGTGSAEELTATAILDFVGSTRGSVLYRGAGGWAILAPGTIGNVLSTNGAGADPTWIVASGGGGNVSTGTVNAFTNLNSFANVTTFGSSTGGATDINWVVMPANDITMALAGNTYNAPTSNQTLTFNSGTPPTTDRTTRFRFFGSASDVTLTFATPPYSTQTHGTISSVFLPASSFISGSITYDVAAARYEITGDPAVVTGTGPFVGQTGALLQAPKMGGSYIADAAGAHILEFTTTASAVNQFAMANGATTHNPLFSATGSDTNVGLDFQPKGTGLFRVTYAGTSKASVDASGNAIFAGTLTAGSAATVLTDSAGKILSAALNTVTAGVGGTGLTTYTKGDLLVATGPTTLVNLGVGANTNVLTADSTQTSGMKWAAAGAGSGTVTSVALTLPSIFSVAGSPVTTTGTLAATFATGQTANQVLATPNGSTGAVGLRSLVAGDMTAPGSTTQVMFNNAGTIAGVAGLTEDPTTGALTETLAAAGTGISMVNSTLAISGTQQNSPSLNLHGSGYKSQATSAAQPVDFYLFVAPVQGVSAPTGTLSIASQINNTSFANRLTIDTAGNVDAQLSLGIIAKSKLTSSADGFMAITNAAGTAGADTSMGAIISTVAGKGLQLQSGTSAMGGDATLVAGTVTVTNVAVTAKTKIQLTRHTPGGVVGDLSYSVSAGASFTITSAASTDTSVVSYLLYEVN